MTVKPRVLSYGKPRIEGIYVWR